VFACCCLRCAAAQSLILGRQFALDNEAPVTYTLLMPVISETETSLEQQLDQVLKALPSLARWLRRSRPAHQLEGHEPVTLSQARVLIHLAQHGPMSMGELARGMDISYSTATECIAALETHGRVAKNRSQSDRRNVVVNLTPDAEAAVSQVLSRRKVLVEKVLERIPPSDRRAFVKGITLLSLEAEAWMDNTQPLGAASMERKVLARA